MSTRGCSRQRVLAVALGAAALAAATAAGAAPADVAASGAGLTGGMSIGEIMQAGGWLMWVLAAMSVLVVAVVIYLFAVLRTAVIAPPELLGELVGRLRVGAVEDARLLCEEQRCALSAVATAGLEFLRSVPQADPAQLKDALEGEGGRQAEDIQGQTQYLLDIAVIAPMVGLLGTVFGMLHAFGAVAHDIAQAKPVVLADGVRIALLTTAFGLLVGIPAMMFYAYFRRRAAKQVLFLESAAADILRAFASQDPERGRISEIKDQLRKA
jgi:biopolymer transport protein ExbB